ncbi:uncharacterized protein LOC141596280 [Silene latifolia]|uniref:uncharacterized protein LOC141596280 n=1 Tax=Silene latifolia TaxID=37657 RepID=UPI003D76B299
MFWRMAGLSTASPVETILGKDKFSLEELLDEDELIQECKALNARLINFLRERPQVEKLIDLVVEEAPEDAEKRRTFKFPFVSCEIITCEVDIILNTLVEDDELMKKLFSFLEPEHSHSTLLAGYFSKVVVCLLMRKTVELMNYIQTHKEILGQLIDLIGITSIMEVLIRLIAADEHIYENYTEAMRWLEDTDVLEMIVDKFSSSDSPEVHANAAETLCAITRYAPPGIATKICSPSLIGRIFSNALEESRPNSVLVNSLSVCISLLDPKRSTVGTYYSYSRQYAQGPSLTANSETVEGMLGSLGNLLTLLDVSSEENVLLTTYGKLQPPLGKQRLKIVEFISVLLSISNDAAEKEVIRLGAVKRILDLFFEYPYNNFLHHHVEIIILSCLENKKSALVEHLLRDCNLVGRILEAEKSPLLSTDPSKPTVCTHETHPARIGNIGHLTRISNKLLHLATNDTIIQGILQENTEWREWCGNVLCNRNAIENVHQWVCGRPTLLQDRGRNSEDDDYQDRDYDMAALANSFSQSFPFEIYSNDMDEVEGSHERDEEDVYVDDESAEVVISSLRLRDDRESDSHFSNSNWFAFEDDPANNETSTGPHTSQLTADEPGPVSTSNDDVNDSEGDEVDTSQEPETESKPPEVTEGGGKEREWVEWRETSSSGDAPDRADKQDKQDAPSNGVEKSDSQVPTNERCQIVDSGGNEHIGGSLPVPSKTTVEDSDSQVPANESCEIVDSGGDEHVGGSPPVLSETAVEDSDSQVPANESCEIVDSGGNEHIGGSLPVPSITAVEDSDSQVPANESCEIVDSGGDEDVGGSPPVPSKTAVEDSDSQVPANESCEIVDSGGDEHVGGSLPVPSTTAVDEVNSSVEAKQS